MGRSRSSHPTLRGNHLDIAFKAHREAHSIAQREPKPTCRATELSGKQRLWLAQWDHAEPKIVDELVNVVVGQSSFGKL